MKEQVKKNLLYIIAGVSALIGLVFMVALIALNNKPVSLNKEYSYTMSLDDYGFGSEYYIEVNATFDGKYITYSGFVGTESTTETYEYKINGNHQLFVKFDADDWKLFGKVNACEIEVDKSITSSNGINFTMILQCKSAKIAKGFCIAFTSLGLTAGAVLTIVKVLMDKKAKNIIELKGIEQ